MEIGSETEAGQRSKERARFNPASPAGLTLREFGIKRYKKWTSMYQFVVPFIGLESRILPSTTTDTTL